MSKRDYKSYGILDNEINVENKNVECVIDEAIEKNNHENTNIITNEQVAVLQVAYHQETNDSFQLKKIEDHIEDKPIVNFQYDTSFEKYKKDNPLKKRSGVVKWSLRFLKVLVFIMLSPLIGMIVACVLAVVAVIVAAIFACFGAGIGILGSICFVCSQISASLVALGVSVSIAFLSLGGIILVLSIMATKGLVGLVHKWRTRKKVKVLGGQ